jgi:hypothetical protein
MLGNDFTSATDAGLEVLKFATQLLGLVTATIAAHRALRSRGRNRSRTRDNTHKGD